jgi:hypothetical protein
MLENINQKPSSRDQNNELFGERKSVVGALYVNNERARPHCVSAQPNATLAFVDMHSSSASRAGSLVALAAACVSALPTPALAATSLSFDAATGLISGTISTATVPSVTTVPAAAALLGAVGYTTAEKLIYGPFEAGFGRGPDETATSDTRPPFPCLDAATATYSGYCPGGMDVGTCEAGLYNTCAAGSVRASLFMDDCGGHANPYHHHTDPTCLYDASAEGHSALVGVMLDGRALFGRNEASGAPPADLDACGGHMGPVPAYADWGIDADTRVYHYHAQLKPPYLLGCYGPVASVAACKDLYAAGTRKCDAAAADVRIGESYSLEYDLFCPCYDGYEVPEHVVTEFEGTDVAPAGDAHARPERPASAAPRGRRVARRMLAAIVAIVAVAG